MVTLRTTFAANLRATRKANGISQENFARMAGISRAYISTLENGAKAPTLDTVERLAGALGVDATVLLRR